MTTDELDAAMATLRDQHATQQRADTRRAWLRSLATQAEDAKAARRTALATIGQILREDRADGDLVGITGAQTETGISRPTLTGERDDTAAWDELVALARRTLAVGDDHGDETALHARLPRLAGWYHAAQHLDRVYRQGRDYDPMAMDLDDEAPGYAVLMDEYLAQVRRIAAGHSPAND